MKSKETLTFLESLSKQAMETKDVGLLSRIGGNPALSHYFTNVHSLKAVTPEWWAANYPQFMVEADRLREKVEADQQTEGYGKRLDTLESKIDKLTEALTPLIEGKAESVVPDADVPPAPPAAPPKPKPGVKPTPNTTPPAPPIPEDDAETEPDDAEDEDADKEN